MSTQSASYFPPGCFTVSSTDDPQTMVDDAAMLVAQQTAIGGGETIEMWQLQQQVSLLELQLQGRGQQPLPVDPQRQPRRPDLIIPVAGQEHLQVTTVVGGGADGHTDGPALAACLSTGQTAPFGLGGAFEPPNQQSDLQCGALPPLASTRCVPKKRSNTMGLAELIARQAGECCSDDEMASGAGASAAKPVPKAPWQPSRAQEAVVRAAQKKKKLPAPSRKPRKLARFMGTLATLMKKKPRGDGDLGGSGSD